MTFSLTSELDAINTMLATIGEAPLNSLDSTAGVADSVIARAVLKEVNLQVQSEGWHFNTDKQMTLQRTTTGEIQLPANCLQVDTVGVSMGVDVTARGNRLYNRRTHTYVFDSDLVVDLVVFLEFSELPPPARYYIMVKAARVFQQRVLGSDTLHSFTANDETRARIALRRLESATSDNNILSGSYSVARVLRR